MKVKSKFTVGGLFAGIGGIEAGFEKGGFDISWANEVDKHACKTYRLNHPRHKLIEGNIYDSKVIDPKKLEQYLSKFIRLEPPPTIIKFAV